MQKYILIKSEEADRNELCRELLTMHGAKKEEILEIRSFSEVIRDLEEKHFICAFDLKTFAPTINRYVEYVDEVNNCNSVLLFVKECFVGSHENIRMIPHLCALGVIKEYR